ncbi:MAG: hypothetical protein H7222_15685 [Methylotenera sp.]|nr:hypothetical protein [Oligoflexia bacterium]
MAAPFDPTFIALAIFLTFILVVGGLVLILSRKKRKEYEPFIRFFRGKASPFGSISFISSDTRFHLDRMASGAGISGGGGSYPMLWTYVNPHFKLIVGNAKSGTYTRGSFLRLPPHEVITLHGVNLLIGASERTFVEAVRSLLLGKPELCEALGQLFERDFGYLTVGTEIHLGGAWVFQKKCVLRHTGLPEKIYEDPSILVAHLETITSFLAEFGVTFERKR